MAQDQDLLVRIAADTRALRRELDRAAQASRQTGSKIRKDFDSAGGSIDRLSGAARALKISLAAIAAGAGIGLVAKIGRDVIAMQSLQAGLTGVTGSAGNAALAMQDMLDVSRETGVAVASSVQTFNRFAIASDAIGRTHEEAAQLVEVVQKLGSIGGTSVRDISGASVQLGQALSSGRLQGDELRSILERMPVLAVALADALGVGVGELKRLGSEGKLTSDVVFNALLSKTDEVNARFADLPLTVERSAGRLEAAWSGFILKLDESVGFTETLADLINGMADALNRAAGAGQEFRWGDDLAAARVEAEALRAELARIANLSGRGPGERRADLRARIGALEAVDAELQRARLLERIAQVEAEITAVSDSRQRGKQAQLQTARDELAVLQEQLNLITLQIERASGRGGGAGESGPPAVVPAVVAPVVQDAGSAVAEIDRVAAAIDELEHQLTLVGQNDFNVDLANRLRALGIEFQVMADGAIRSDDARARKIAELMKALRDEAAAIDKVAAAERRRDRLLEAVKTDYDRYIEALKEAQELYDQELLTKQELLKIQKMLRDEYDKTQQSQARAKTVLEQYSEAAQDTKGNLEDLTVNGLRAMEDAILDVTDGTKTLSEAFSDMARSILRDLQRMMIQKNITGPLGKILQGGIDDLFGGESDGGVASLFRAGGGDIRAGQRVTVGERGPELFVPDVAGKVVRNGASAGAGSGGGAPVANITLINPTRDMIPEMMAQLQRLGIRVNHIDTSLEGRAVSAVRRGRGRDGAAFFGGAA